jgi:hypothetical protein
MPLPQSIIAPADKRTKASASPRISELNNMASTLAVYASDFGYPESARLASGDWQGLSGWISTTGLNCQFQDCILAIYPKAPDLAWRHLSLRALFAFKVPENCTTG